MAEGLMHTVVAEAVMAKDMEVALSGEREEEEVCLFIEMLKIVDVHVEEQFKAGMIFCAFLNVGLFPWLTVKPCYYVMPLPFMSLPSPSLAAFRHKC